MGFRDCWNGKFVKFGLLVFEKVPPSGARKWFQEMKVVSEHARKYILSSGSISECARKLLFKPMVNSEHARNGCRMAELFPSILGSVLKPKR
jgi:hypothetical protein